MKIEGPLCRFGMALDLERFVGGWMSGDPPLHVKR
jgi:hypothetical protein